jgi:hypothetical protein
MCQIEGPHHLKPTLSCAYPCTNDNTLRKNPTNALIYVNTALFTPLHCYMLCTDTFREQGQQNMCQDVNIRLKSSVFHVT